jgi:hypothetical protein
MSAPILLALAGALSLQPDNPVFPPGLTCRDAADAEAQYGSQPLGNPDFSGVPKSPFVFKRSFDGLPSSVVYMCNSDRRVRARFIYVQFSSQETATTAFDTYSDAYTVKFGAPCDPPKSVSIPQDQGTPAGPGKSTLDIRTVAWKARPDVITRLTLMPTGQAQLLIETNVLRIKKPPVVSSDEVNRQVPRASSCGLDEEITNHPLVERP